MPERANDEDLECLLVVVGVKDGQVDVVVGPYTYPEDATAFVRHAQTQGPDDVAYQVVRMLHPLQWQRASPNSPD